MSDLVGFRGRVIIGATNAYLVESDYQPDYAGVLILHNSELYFAT
jgi:hypothetical protein